MDYLLVGVSFNQTLLAFKLGLMDCRLVCGVSFQTATFVQLCLLLVMVPSLLYSDVRFPLSELMLERVSDLFEAGDG